MPAGRWHGRHGTLPYSYNYTMKLYQALSLLLFVGASCTDAPRSIDLDGREEISFGLIEPSDGSRALELAVVSPDEMTLKDGCGDIAPVKAYVTVADMPTSAIAGSAAPIHGIEDLESFGIYSFFYASDSDVAKPFFENEMANGDAGYWTTSTPYYWPTVPGSTLTFWAMAGLDALGVSVAEATDSPGQMEIRYTVPQRANEQHDLMLATTGRINTPGERVPLKFSHLCAAARFVTGKEMQPGIIKRIVLSGIKSQGVYTTIWSNLAGNTSFTVDVNKTMNESQTAGTAKTPDDNMLMMLPQTLGDDAVMTVVFQDKVTGNERELTASLKGQTWKQGTTTTYHIGITPEYEIEFTQPVDIQDATYVICNSAIRVSGVPDGKTWTLTVGASDGSDPSVQLTADVNEYVKQGFWTDKEMRNGSTVTNISARGSKTVKGSGSGEFPLTVFLPENVSATDRTVTLSLSVDGAPARYTATQEITQLPPSWNGNMGWEQIDDKNTGVYGFDYEARHVYVYNNSHSIVPANNVVTQVQRLIEQYEASGYASVVRYNVSLVSYRNYVDINYRKLNTLDGKAVSTIDGQLNTRQLFSFGGTALSNNFEKALLEMTRVGDSSSKAYRKVDGDKDVPQWVDGTLINESQMLVDVLKKNKYYLNTSVVGDLTTTTPLIRAEDIVWYIPASGQFAGAPAWYGGAPMNNGDFWSSTAGDAGYAYSGSGVSTPRTATKSVRVARNR